MTARNIRTIYFTFGVFGAFWGVWGAAIPVLRDQAGLSAGQLGTALLWVGAGALPAMFGAGRIIDRFPRVVTGTFLTALAGAGVLVAFVGQNFVTISICLAIVGLTSGASDVAINATAGAVENATGRPVVARSHAVFSVAVVIGSLATGVALSTSLPPVVPFAVVLAVALCLCSGATPMRDPQHNPPSLPPATRTPVLQGRIGKTLTVAGCFAAIAFAIENAHQSWSAIFMTDVLSVGPLVASFAPAAFAGVVAVTRWTTGTTGQQRPMLLLLAGALAAGLGTAGFAASDSIAALVWLGVAAAGTGVLFPTLMSLVSSTMPDHARGRATAVVAGIGYLGFLLGPVAVGQVTEVLGLRGALLSVAGLAALLCLILLTARSVLGERMSSLESHDARCDA